MGWYKSYKLIKDNEGYTLEIVLNQQSEEFSQEFLDNIKTGVLQLDEKVRNFADEKFRTVRINSAKLLIGSVLVATIPFSFSTVTRAADTVTTSTTQIAAQPGDVTISGTQGTVTSYALNVRSGPSTDYSIIRVLYQGNKDPVTGESGGWYRIQLSDGRTGYVNSHYFDIGVPQKINTVVSGANALIGTPYMWGGNSLQAGGFDCSGLTQYVFGQAGYHLNRVSADQVKQGLPETRDNIKPGDLIFYSFNMDGTISHVGIYIGNGKMIHSPRTGETVMVTDITTAYWESRFVTARRIIY